CSAIFCGRITRGSRSSSRNTLTFDPATSGTRKQTLQRRPACSDTHRRIGCGKDWSRRSPGTSPIFPGKPHKSRTAEPPARSRLPRHQLIFPPSPRQSPPVAFAGAAFGCAAALAHTALERHDARGESRRVAGAAQRFELLENPALVPRDDVDRQMHTPLDLAGKRVDAEKNDYERTQQQPDQPIPHLALLDSLARA